MGVRFPKLILAAALPAAVIACAPRSPGVFDPSRLVRDVNRQEPREAAAVEYVESHPWGALRIDEYRMANGLKILLIEDHSAPVFAYQTWFDVGSANERPGITGIAHLFEHLMFKETSNTSEGEFDKTLEGRGGRLNASTWEDWTFYRDNLPSGNLDVVARLEADRMRNLVLNEAQVNSERSVVMNERRFRIDNSPLGTMYEELYALAFTRHPYRWPTVGWMKDLEAITLGDCVEFYDTYYAPNNATVVIVGDFDSGHALRTLRAHYGKMKPSTIPEEAFEAEPAQKEPRRKELELALGAQKLVIGYRQVSARNPHHAAVEVLHTMLLDGESSRVHRRLVANEKIATEVSGWVSPWKYPGLYEVVVSMKPGVEASRAEPLLYEELAAIGTDELPADELAKAKNRLETQFRQKIATSGGKARVLGHYQTTNGDYADVLDVVERYRKVTAEEVQQVARDMFTEANRTVILARPAPGKEDSE